MKRTRSHEDRNASLYSFLPVYSGRFLIPYLVVLMMKLQRIRRTRYPRRKTPNPTRTLTTFWLNFMISPHGFILWQSIKTSNPHANREIACVYGGIFACGERIIRFQMGRDFGVII